MRWLTSDTFSTKAGSLPRLAAAAADCARNDSHLSLRASHRGTPNAREVVRPRPDRHHRSGIDLCQRRPRRQHQRGAIGGRLHHPDRAGIHHRLRRGALKSAAALPGMRCQQLESRRRRARHRGVPSYVEVVHARRRLVLARGRGEPLTLDAANTRQATIPNKTSPLVTTLAGGSCLCASQPPSMDVP